MPRGNSGNLDALGLEERCRIKQEIFAAKEHTVQSARNFLCAVHNYLFGSDWRLVTVIRSMYINLFFAMIREYFLEEKFSATSTIKSTVCSNIYAKSELLQYIATQYSEIYLVPV